MPGKWAETYHIREITPSQYMGYRHIIVQVGINDLRDNSKGRKPDDPPPDAIQAHFENLVQKLEHIQVLCPKSNIILAPILPTKLTSLSNRAQAMNRRLSMYTARQNPQIRLLLFESVAYGAGHERDGLLIKEFGRYLNPDPLHLGKSGSRKLAQMYMEAIFRPKVDARPFSSLFTHDCASYRET